MNRDVLFFKNNPFGIKGYFDLDPDLVRKRKRDLLKKYHPDLNKNKKEATENTREIIEQEEVFQKIHLKFEADKNLFGISDIIDFSNILSKKDVLLDKIRLGEEHAATESQVNESFERLKKCADELKINVQANEVNKDLLAQNNKRNVEYRIPETDKFKSSSGQRQQRYTKRHPDTFETTKEYHYSSYNEALKRLKELKYQVKPSEEVSREIEAIEELLIQQREEKNRRLKKVFLGLLACINILVLMPLIGLFLFFLGFEDEILLVITIIVVVAIHIVIQSHYEAQSHYEE